MSICLQQVDYHHSMYGQNVASDEANEGEKDDGYDLIELTGCGKISQWRFPKDLERCPISSCQELFDDRFEAIDHYRKEHAKNSILCYICAIPIYTYSFKDFEAHFNRMHPNDGIPFQFNQKIKQEPQPAKVCIEINLLSYFLVSILICYVFRHLPLLYSAEHRNCE